MSTDPEPRDTVSTTSKLKAYLLCYVPSPLFPCHWSLWIPFNGQSGPGMRIHVTGDARNGFQHDIERAYDPKQDDRHPKVIELGNINTSSLPGKEPVCFVISGVSDETLVACSALEYLSLTIPAPGPSLKSSSTTGGRLRVKIQNCQTWLRQLVDSMIDKGVIGAEARHIVDQAPQH
ncbi:hypothetical protein GE09DRAFT_1215793 [Coniochaeta sp. 2T2.1]|nr:hypothetical protein GE09DRAFT_1215793 [Coniochaeta sp. 2T2.1]